MKRIFALALLTAALPTLVFAYPVFGGGRGLFRVENAQVEQEAGLTLSLHALTRQAEFPASPGATNSNGWIADLIAPELSYAPVAMKYVGLELFGSWGGAVQFPRSATEDGLVGGFHDLRAGGKLSVPILPVLKLGGVASYVFKWRQTKSDWTVLDPGALPYDPSRKLTWRGLVTLHLQDVLPSAPNLLASYGKTADIANYGAGVELQGKGFGLFVEALSQQPDNSSSGMFDTKHGHIHVTPGITFGSAASTMLKLGYTISLGGDSQPAKPPNEFIVGLGFSTPFGQRAPSLYGQIVGTVTDASNGHPLAATISFPDHPRMAQLTADAATGVFRAPKVRAGAVTVEVSAEGYSKQAMPLAVENNKVVSYEFKLRPLKTYGTIAGTVVDAVTNAPMAARIEFPGSSLTPVQADPSAGAFKVERVETGVYTVTASAEQYVRSTITLAVEANKLAPADFRLSPTVGAVTVTGKVSDKKTGDPLAATVTIPEAGSAVFAADPGTGVYKAELMPGAYAMVVEADGYLKQTAALVVERDKPVARDFALVKEGMALTLRGIYFNTGKASIKPESRTALEDAARILKENPTIKVEIQGHTDSQGSDAFNQTLSEQRAWSVVNYLVKQLGIDLARLTAKGYGESRPVADNETAEGRTLNRRVEFVITGQTEK